MRQRACYLSVAEREEGPRPSLLAHSVQGLCESLGTHVSAYASASDVRKGCGNVEVLVIQVPRRSLHRETGRQKETLFKTPLDQDLAMAALETTGAGGFFVGG